MKKYLFLTAMLAASVCADAQDHLHKSAPFDLRGQFSEQLDSIDSPHERVKYSYSFEDDKLKISKKNYSSYNESYEMSEGTYDLDGHLVDSIHGEYYTDWKRWYGDFHTTYKYNDRGLLVEERAYYNPCKTTFAYDDQDRLVEKVYALEKGTDVFVTIQRYRYVYDERGNLTQEACDDYDKESSKYKPNTVTDRTYNERGQMLSMKETMYYLNDPGSFTASTEKCEYDAAGNLLSYVKRDLNDNIIDKSEYTYDERGRERSHILYSTDLDGKIVPYDTYHIDYDERDSVCLKTLIRGQYNNVYDCADKWERTYDERGNITEYKHFTRYATYEDWACVEHWTKMYDEQDRMFWFNYYVKPADSRFSSTSIYYEEDGYTVSNSTGNGEEKLYYDNNGRLLRKTYNNSDIRNTYNADGKLTETKEIYLKDGVRRLKQLDKYTYDNPQFGYIKESYLNYNYDRYRNDELSGLDSVYYYTIEKYNHNLLPVLKENSDVHEKRDEAHRVMKYSKVIYEYNSDMRETLYQEYDYYNDEWSLLTEYVHAYAPNGEETRNSRYTYDYWTGAMKPMSDMQKKYDYNVLGSEIMNNVKNTPYKLLEYINNEEVTTYYYAPVCHDLTDIPGVETGKSASAHPVAFYDLSGKKLSEPREGVMIIRMSDGSAKKVMWKNRY